MLDSILCLSLSWVLSQVLVPFIMPMRTEFKKMINDGQCEV